MLRAIAVHKPRAPPQWRVILSRVRQNHTEVMEAHPLEAMLHWRDPVERLRRIQRRRSLLEDNPSSG